MLIEESGHFAGHKYTIFAYPSRSRMKCSRLETVSSHLFLDKSINTLSNWYVSREVLVYTNFYSAISISIIVNLFRSMLCHIVSRAVLVYTNFHSAIRIEIIVQLFRNFHKQQKCTIDFTHASIIPLIHECHI